MGGDWSYPIDLNQVAVYFKSLGYSWTHSGNLFGIRELAPMSILYFSIFKFFSFFGITGDVTTKVIIILLFTFSASNMFLLLTKYKMNFWVKFFAGIIYFSTPIFFNYLLMGWIYVILSLAILPLFVYLFTESIERNDFRLAILAAVVFSFAVLQSQTAVWYPIVLAAIVVGYVIKSFKDCGKCIKMFCVTIFSFGLLNLYWLPGVVLYPDQLLTSNDLVTSSISMGTTLRLSAVNILRTWGSLFNYQFETAFPGGLEIVTFILPLLAVLSFSFWKKFAREISFLFIIFCVPMFFYLLDRGTLASLPFSNVIRDIARFSMLSTFAVVVLAAISLDNIVKSKIAYRKVILSVLALILFLNLLPFVNGSLFGNKNTSDYDFRMRTKVWPDEYKELEAKFAKEENARALCLPIGGTLSINSDSNFSGDYRQTWDIYANFSNVPGMIGFSDRDNGVSSDLIELINTAIKNRDIEALQKYIEIGKIDFLVFRRDVDAYTGAEDDFNSKLEADFKNLISDEKAESYFDKNSLLVLKFNNAEKVQTYDQTTVVSSTISDSASLIFQNSAQSSEVISDSDFNQISQILNLEKYVGNSAYSFNGQNQIYGQKVEQEKVFQIVSLEKINNIILRKKWLAAQKNQDFSLDTGLRKNNDKLIEIADNIRLTGSVAGKYYFNLPEDSLVRIYFQNSAETAIKINDQSYSIKSYLDINLKKGLNLIDSSDNSPLFVVDKNYLEKITSEKNKNSQPNIKYKKINPTMYEIEISNFSADFSLELSEAFNSFWRIYDSEKINAKQIISDKNHFVINGYANGWNIKTADLNSLKVDENGSVKFYITFWPQKMFIIGTCISVFALFLSALLICKRRKK